MLTHESSKGFTNSIKLGLKVKYEFLESKDLDMQCYMARHTLMKKKMSSNKFFVIRLNHVSFFPIATGTVR